MKGVSKVLDGRHSRQWAGSGNGLAIEDVEGSSKSVDTVNSINNGNILLSRTCFCLARNYVYRSAFTYEETFQYLSIFSSLTSAFVLAYQQSIRPIGPHKRILSR